MNACKLIHQDRAVSDETAKSDRPIPGRLEQSAGKRVQFLILN